MGDRGLGGAIMRVAAIGRRGQAGDRADRDDLAGTLSLHDWCNGVAAIDGAEQVHADHETEQRRIDRARLGVDRPSAAASGIGDQHIHPAPLFDDAGRHSLDCPVVADIAFNAERRAARSLDFRDGRFRRHVLRLGIELPVRFEVEIGDRDFCTQARQAPRIGAAEPARRAGNDCDLAVELAHQFSSPQPGLVIVPLLISSPDRPKKFPGRAVFAVIYSKLSAVVP